MKITRFSTFSRKRGRHGMTLTELAIVVLIIVVFISGLWYVASQVRENRDYNLTMNLIGTVMTGMHSFKGGTLPAALTDVTNPQTLDLIGVQRDVWDPVNAQMLDPYGNPMFLQITPIVPDGVIVFQTTGGAGTMTQARCLDILLGLINSSVYYTRLTSFTINGTVKTNGNGAVNITKANLAGACVPGFNAMTIEFAL